MPFTNFCCINSAELRKGANNNYTIRLPGAKHCTKKGCSVRGLNESLNCCSLGTKVLSSQIVETRRELFSKDSVQRRPLSLTDRSLKASSGEPHEINITRVLSLACSALPGERKPRQVPHRPRPSTPRLGWPRAPLATGAEPAASCCRHFQRTRKRPCRAAVVRKS